MHPFETTLGPGPYKFIGVVSIRVSEHGTQLHGNVDTKTIKSGLGTCSHCSTAIMNCFIIETANKERFGVGCDCIRKVGLPYAEMTKVEVAEKLHERQLRKARVEKKAVDYRSRFKDLLVHFEEVLKSKPHPTPYHAEQGKTLFDYAQWLNDHSSDSAVPQAYKRVEILMK